MLASIQFESFPLLIKSNEQLLWYTSVLVTCDEWCHGKSRGAICCFCKEHYFNIHIYSFTLTQFHRVNICNSLLSTLSGFFSPYNLLLVFLPLIPNLIRVLNSTVIQKWLWVCVSLCVYNICYWLHSRAICKFFLLFF